LHLQHREHQRDLTDGAVLLAAAREQGQPSHHVQEIIAGMLGVQSWIKQAAYKPEFLRMIENQTAFQRRFEQAIRTSAFLRGIESIPETAAALLLGYRDDA
jgi:hypothetical protein